MIHLLKCTTERAVSSRPGENGTPSGPIAVVFPCKDRRPGWLTACSTGRGAVYWLSPLSESETPNAVNNGAPSVADARPAITAMLRSRILALSLVLSSLCASGAWAYVPHEDPADWRWWLHLAHNVSTQGHKGTAFCSKAQDSATVLAEHALSLVQASGTPSPQAEVEIFNGFGDFCFRDDDYESAERYWLGALESAGKDTEPKETMFRLGVLYAKGLRAPSDPEVERRAQHYLAEVRSAGTPEASPRLYVLAEIYARMDFLEEFYDCHRQIFALWQANPNSDSRWAVRSLVFLGEHASKVDIGNEAKPASGQDSAIIYGTWALELSESRFGSTDTLTAFVMYRLGDYHSRNGNYDIAAGMWKRAWEIYRQAVPPEHIEYQGGLIRVRSLELSSGHFLEAEQLSREALRLRSETQGPGHPETAGMWTGLARVFHRTGRFDAADSCYREALRIRREALELIPSDVALALLNVGGLQSDFGDLAGAEATYLEALAILDSAHGRLHDRTAACLSELGELCLAWGRAAQAQAYFEAAYNARLEYLAPSHPELAASLEELAQVEIQRGNADSAAHLLAGAFAIHERQAAWLPGSHAALLTRMAEVETLRGEAARALEFAQAALEKAKVAMGPEHPGLAMYLNTLGSAQSGMEMWSEAAAAFQASIDFHKRLPGVAHPAFADAYEGLARVRRAQGDSRAALAAGLEALSLRRQAFTQGAWVMSERDALKFETALHETRDLVLSVYFDAHAQKGAIPAEVADAILATKGAVPDIAFAREAGRRARSDRASLATQDTLSALKARLWYSFTRGVNGPSPTHADPEAELVQAEIERLQTEIARSLGSYASVSTEPPSSRQLAAQLPAGSALIEYIKYGHLHTGVDQTDDRYAALILASQREPMAVDLESAARTDSLVGAYRRHMLKLSTSDRAPDAQDLAEYSGIADALKQSIWMEFEDQLPPAGTLLIAPDGELNRISFAGLPADSGYLEEYFRIHYLGSGRDLLRPHVTTTVGSGLLALGDPDFDAAPADRLDPLASTAPLQLAGTSAYALGTQRAGCEGMFTGTLQRLRGTRLEVTQLCSAWNAISAVPAKLLAGPSASEEAFKRYAGGSRVLHLATHGFYVDGSCGERTISTPELANLSRENPLLLSGLLLAGANRGGEEARRLGVDDGVLTALEVAGLDLAGTQLVVLSACESAAGDVKAGEGVYGLRRAFALAGAQTVVSALWPVSDWSTIPFVTSLYQESGASIPDRMQQAALARLADLRKRGEVDHPYHWAAFVAIGDTDAEQKGQGLVTSVKR